MKLGLRIKIVGIVGFALAVMLFFWSYKDLKTLKTQYLQTVQAHAEVMAQFLIFLAQGEIAEGYTKQYVLDVEQHGAKLPDICQKVLTVNPNKQAIYVAVISARKTLIAHSDPKQTDLHIRDTRALDQIGGYKISTAFDAARGTLDLFIPTFNLKNEYIGVINIGFSSREALAQFAKWKKNAISIDLLFLGIACLIILIIIDLIVTRPIKYLIKIGERLAEGYPIHSLTMTERGDEIALLSRVFVQTSDYLQEITGIAQNVATGALAHDVRKRSKRDALGVALQDMLSYLQTLAEIGSRIARGDLTSMPFLRSDIDAFGRAMRDMTVGLQSLIQQIRVSAEQISGTGLNLATLSDNDMDIVQSTQSAVDQMISTMTQMGQSVAEGKIISSSVNKTKAVVNSHISKRANQELTVVVSKGVRMTTIPKDILDANSANGKDPLNALKKAGFDNVKHDESKDEYSMDTPQGVALTISPDPGTTAKHNDEVTVTLSKGPMPVTMPNIVGKTQDEMQAALGELKLTANVTEQYDDKVEAGQVISASQEAGAQLKWGDSVDVVISKGPEMATIPSGLVGKQESAVTKTLEGLGFEVKTDKVLDGLFGTVRTVKSGDTDLSNGGKIRLRDANGNPTVITLTIV